MTVRSQIDFWSRLAFFAAAATLAAAPFEALRPALQLPGQSLSSLEAVLALALLVWVFSLTARRRLPSWNPLIAPALAVLGALLLSALAAAEHQREALLFTARQTAGVLIMLMIADAVDSRRRLRWALTCGILSASLVAFLGILEYFEFPSALRLLGLFRLDLSLAGVQPRVSSTLQYPTIASMYLEIAFGFALGLLTAARRRIFVAAALTTGVLIGSGVILTLTRSGLATMGAAWALAAWLQRRRGVGRLPRLLLLAAFLALVLASVLAAREDYWLRLTTADQTQWYRAEYETPEVIQLRTGELRVIPIVVRNVGLASWTPGGKTPFRLSYHWLDGQGERVVHYEGLRTELPRTVRAGASARIWARVLAPPQPGRYVLAWDLLSEYRFWFSRENAPSGRTRAVVSGPPVEASALVLQPRPQPRFLLSRTRLWRIAARLFLAHPLLGVGADNFRLVYGDREGLPIWDPTYHTHNMFIEFFVSAGLLGGAAFLWLLWRLARILAKGCSTAPPRLFPLALGVTAAAAAIVLHGLVDYFLEFTPTYVMIWACFGLAAGSWNHGGRTGHSRRGGCGWATM